MARRTSVKMKVLGAFLLGVVLTIVAAQLMPAGEDKVAPVSSSQCATAGNDDDELSDRRALDTKLDAIEREITSDPIVRVDRDALRQAILVERR